MDPDPDPPQNVMGPQHWYLLYYTDQYQQVLMGTDSKLCSVAYHTRF